MATEQNKPKATENNERKHTVFLNLCKGCGMCIEKCPVKCIKWDENNQGAYNTPTVEADIEKCTACGICQQICPDSAIRVVKKATDSQNTPAQE